MKFTCCKCGYTTIWDPVKKGGSVPPNFVMKKYKGKVETFCTACWPPHEETDSKAKV